MRFKPMSEEAIFEILKDHEDVLTKQVNERATLYESQCCPTCGSSMRPEADVNRILRADGVPKMLCRCPICRCLIDPFSGIIIEYGNKGEVEPAIPLIHIDED